VRYLITGASSGLGASIALALREKHEVMTLGRRPTDTLQCLAIGRDMQTVTDAIKFRCDGLAGIIHCAGIELVSPLRMTPDHSYGEAMFAADSAFAILRAAASKGVMADGGSIVLMSSVAAHRSTAGMVAYSAGKGAIEAMVRSAAAELAPRRIRVNALAAGAFRSPMHDRITKRMPQAAQDAYSASHPLGFGSVEDVARAVLNLLDEPWTTGTVRIVDGGYLS
jgi:NAD(P)-dependent dehydrogenase (short-subunit alcohol dehydrogenase family)